MHPCVHLFAFNHCKSDANHCTNIIPQSRSGRFCNCNVWRSACPSEVPRAGQYVLSIADSPTYLSRRTIRSSQRGERRSRTRRGILHAAQAVCQKSSGCKTASATSRARVVLCCRRRLFSVCAKHPALSLKGFLSVFSSVLHS